MREQLSLAHPDVKTLDAHSTEIPLPPQSVDAVLCAQSFHWFANIETLNEIYQLLKIDGHLGLIWNQRDIEVNWVKALADILQPLEQDTPRYHSGDWKKYLSINFYFDSKVSKFILKFKKGQWSKW
jgi:SAM-dependent methyltransferase